MQTVYDTSYEMTSGVIDLMMQLSFFFWPFMLVLLVLLVFRMASGWSFRGTAGDEERD
jgi:hypothetical protein